MIEEKKLTEEQLEKLRYYLRNRLNGYKGNKKIKINIDPKILEKLIFRNIKNKNSTYKIFDFDYLIEKLDLSDISFDNFNACNYDFSGLYGVKLNPQTIYKKDLSFSKLAGVEIIGPLDDCEMYKTDFTGSVGATMSYNQYVKYGQNNNLTDVEVIEKDLGEYLEKINEAFRFKK